MEPKEETVENELVSNLCEGDIIETKPNVFHHKRKKKKEDEVDTKISSCYSMKIIRFFSTHTVFLRNITQTSHFLR